MTGDQASIGGPLLDRLRRRKRLIKQLRQLRAADIVVVSYPKSGRTWLATMISNVYHQHHAIAETEIIRFDNFHKLDSSIPRVFFTHDSRPSAPSAPLAGLRDYATKKVVLLVRDPRDVVVSSYFQYTRRNARRAAPADGAAAPALFDYAVTVSLPKLVPFLKRWHDHLGLLERALVVRYEDLRARPAAELGRVMAFIGGEVAPEAIERAVAFASFETLRRREAVRFFASARLHPGQADDPDSFKVRRGKVGGYRDYFSPPQLARIEALLAEALPDRFGYRQPAAVPGG